MPDFQRFDPASCDFPRPFAPLLPALRWDDLSFDGKDRPDPALIDAPGARHFSRGRYALHEAYRGAGVGAAGTLLAPSYHCRTMLDPALALGGPVAFYRLNPDLSPELGHLGAMIAASSVAVRALVVPHYFGVEQPVPLMAALAALCERHGITLVEDCSHAWQVAARRAPGLQRHAAHCIVASPYKFFACEDGGILWGGADSAPQPRATLLDEAKALHSAWRRSRAARASAAQVHPGDVQARGSTLAESSEQPSPMYQRGQEGRSSLALSRWVMRHSMLDPLIARRRHYYQQWTEALASLAGARALFPTLAPDCAPYMVPVEIATPDPSFFLLKQAGLPIWRWDDMALSPCPVAARYRLHLLHLPCHQGLSRAQMGAMTALAAKVLA